MIALNNFRQRLDILSLDFMVAVILDHGKRDVKNGLELMLDINGNGVLFTEIKTCLLMATNA